MNKNVTSNRADQPCRDALDMFLTSHLGSLPVAENNAKLVGIVSKSDLMQPARIDRKVGDIPAREVLTVRLGCPIANAIRMLQRRKMGCIPGVDAESKVVGIVGREDVLNYYAQRM